MTMRWTVLGFLLLTTCIAPARAQPDEQPPVIPVAGPEVFCWLLKKHHFAALKSTDDLNMESASRTLIIVFGMAARAREWVMVPPPLPSMLDKVETRIGNLRRFQEHGGAVLLASDYRVTLPEWGLTVSSAFVRQLPPFAYRDKYECPLLESLTTKAPLEFRPPVYGIATNRPSYFRVDSQRQAGALVTLADFRRDSTNDTVVIETPRATGVRPYVKVPPPALPYVLLAGAGDSRYGRGVLIAGHGLFTNAMLLQKDNDNFRFADDCLRWLRHAPGQKLRTHALFIVDGQVITSFDTVLKPPPLPIPTPTVQLVNQLLAGMEREGFLLRVVSALFDIPRTAGITLVALTVLLLLYGVKRAVGQRQRAEAGALLTTGPHAAAPESASLAQQRVRAQIARGGFGDEARAVVRAWFLENAGIPVGDWDRAALVPHAEIDAGWWQRRRLRAEVERLIQLAGSHTPPTFSWAALLHLTRQLHALGDAVRTGRLRFAAGSATPNP